MTMMITITTVRSHIHLQQLPYGTGLQYTQGFYDGDDRSTDEGMHRIKPGHSFYLLTLLDYYGG